MFIIPEAPMHNRLSVLARLAAVGLATAALLAACFTFSPKAGAQRNTRRMHAGSLEALRVTRPEAVDLGLIKLGKELR